MGVLGEWDFNLDWVLQLPTQQLYTRVSIFFTVECVICQAELWQLWRDLLPVKVEYKELPWSMTLSKGDKNITHFNSAFESYHDVDWYLTRGGR